MFNPFASATQGAIKGIGAAIKDVASIFKENPEEAGKRIAELEQAFVKLENISQAQINETMRAEAKSEHWAQWLWRPTIGFTFAGVLINNYILLPYFHAYGMVTLVIPGEVWTAMLVILGASAAGRSWEKQTKITKEPAA